MALHRVFDSPTDPLIFDTGHQSYVHKILTGRRELFDTLRQKDGLSGYPERAESPHDWTESSHASAALSYADGLAKAFELSGQVHRHVVALVGDGALTGGMCWEALNNIAAAKIAAWSSLSMTMAVLILQLSAEWLKTLQRFGYSLSMTRSWIPVSMP